MRGLRPKFPHHTPTLYVGLAQSCFSGSPQARPSFDEALTVLNTVLQVCGGGGGRGAQYCAGWKRGGGLNTGAGGATAYTLQPKHRTQPPTHIHLRSSASLAVVISPSFPEPYPPLAPPTHPCHPYPLLPARHTVDDCESADGGGEMQKPTSGTHTHTHRHTGTHNTRMHLTYLSPNYPPLPAPSRPPAPPGRRRPRAWQHGERQLHEHERAGGVPPAGPQQPRGQGAGHALTELDAQPVNCQLG